MTATGQGRENSGRQIRLFLVDGTPSGVMKAEIVNWTGKALAAPRARFADLVHCEESCRTGIYVLIGPDPDRANGLKCYIGEADHVGKRLPRHADDDDKDFFDRVAFVVSKDENLTKAHVRYLESQLIRMTREAGSVQLANGTEPEFALLPEADRSDMAFFLGQLRIVLPILGIDLFRPDQAASSLRGEAAQSPIFELQSVDASATGRDSDLGFIVLAGSTARKRGTSSFPQGYRSVRDQLVADGKLADDGHEEHYRFAVDVAFPSPSAAASVVMAGSANGQIAWKERGSGQPYRHWRSAQLGG
jgi:hypothetical protein